MDFNEQSWAYTLNILENAHRERCGSDRLFCYTASHCNNSENLWRLSLVEENEPGHFPLSEDIAIGSEAKMRALAEKLNRERLKMTPSQAVFIVASSMTGDVERKQRRNVPYIPDGRKYP